MDNNSLTIGKNRPIYINKGRFKRRIFSKDKMINPDKNLSNTYLPRTSNKTSRKKEFLRRINDNITIEIGQKSHRSSRRGLRKGGSNQNSKHVFSNPQIRAQEMSDSIAQNTLDTFDIVSPQDQSNSSFVHKPALNPRPEFPKTNNMHHTK